jgi:NAD(P)-dependent dehydrogenase (short-subunit alcohol dehydrogenase family)
MAGKVIAITGANGGLGRALAQRFAADGERVVLLGRTLAKVEEIAALIGDAALAVECDVSAPASVRAAFETVARTHAAIDVLVNNAAIFKPVLVEEASDEMIVDTVLTNLAGPILCTRAAIPMLGRGGHIINISSESVEVPFPHLTLYQATKGGLERFSHHCQAELSDKGIRVTTVRAGQMIGPGSSAEFDPVAFGRFFEAAGKRGLDLMGRGVTQYASTLDLFRMLVDLPADLHVGLVTLQSRPAA